MSNPFVLLLIISFCAACTSLVVCILDMKAFLSGGRPKKKTEANFPPHDCRLPIVKGYSQSRTVRLRESDLAKSISCLQDAKRDLNTIPLSKESDFATNEKTSSLNREDKHRHSNLEESSKNEILS